MPMSFSEIFIKNKSQIHGFWPLAYLKENIANYPWNLFSQVEVGCCINHKMGVFVNDNHNNLVTIIC